MQVGISLDVWAGWLRQPIARGLLLSIGLHFAFIVLFQAAPGASGPYVVVINARLQPATTRAAENEDAANEDAAKAPAVITETPTQTPPQEPPQTPPSSSMLTAMTPSPAPPVTQAPAPAREPEPISTPTSTPTSAPTSAPTPAPTPAPAPVPATVDTSAAPAATARGAAQESGLPSLPIGIDTNWYLARQVDVHPRAIGQIEPVYPEDAKRRNIEGTLKLMLKIDDLGRVQSAEVVEATPPGVFDAAALAAFGLARFQPALKDGRPVRYLAYFRVEFKLKD